jgi:hypothetical protein
VVVVLKVETERVEVIELLAVTGTLAGFKEGDGPLGDALAFRLTVPEKPLRLVTFMDDVTEEPWITVSEVGLAVIEKSGAA